jgi:hypothetical protein
MDTFGDYSRMCERSAGQLWADDAVASQWAWSPQPDGTSELHWGDPAHWPPMLREVFVHDGDWVLLKGWHDNGTFYDLAIDYEYATLGEGRVRLPKVDGQHYARWEVPPIGQGYELFTAGTITEQSSGKVVYFAHLQTWDNIGERTNAYGLTAPCLAQHESWWDDNRSPFALRIARTNLLAKELGMGFSMEQTKPAPWAAALRWEWRWS